MFIVPRVVYDRMLNNEKEIESLIVSTKEDLEFAKELGDLSENSAYDSAKYRLEVLNSVYDSNERFMQQLKIGSDEELKATKMFKRFTLSLEQIGVQTDSKKQIEGILTPPIKLDLDTQQIYSDSEVGKKLLETDDKSFWVKKNEVFIRVEVIGIEDVDY